MVTPAELKPGAGQNSLACFTCCLGFFSIWIIIFKEEENEKDKKKKIVTIQNVPAVGWKPEIKVSSVEDLQ